MCGRFTLTASVQVVQDLFELRTAPDPPQATFNIAPTQDVLTVREGDDGREAELMRWGLIPHWAEDKSIGNKLINARAETAASKPAFRDAFDRRRCLVVADGFIEWQKIEKRKQPHWMQMADRAPFGFAGLWERWRAEDGEWLHSCTILTTTPNELVAPIHNRMPVIVARADHATWLASASKPEALQELLRPFPADQMRSTAVSMRVNSVANDDAECLTPVETQGTLL